MKEHKSTKKPDTLENVRKTWIKERFSPKANFLHWQRTRTADAAKREAPKFSSDIIKMANKIKSAEDHEKRFLLSLLYFNIQKFEKKFWELSKSETHTQAKVFKHTFKNKQSFSEFDKLMKDALVLESIFTDNEIMEMLGGLNTHMEQQAEMYLCDKKLVHTKFNFAEKAEDFIRTASTMLATGTNCFETNPEMSRIRNNEQAVNEIETYMRECEKYGGWRVVEQIAEELERHGSLKKLADRQGTDAAEHLRKQGYRVWTDKDEAMFFSLRASEGGQVKDAKLISSFELERFIKVYRKKVMGNLMKH